MVLNNMGLWSQAYYGISLLKCFVLISIFGARVDKKILFNKDFVIFLMQINYDVSKNKFYNNYYSLIIYIVFYCNKFQD